MAPTQLSIVLERMLNELGIADLSTFEAVLTCTIQHGDAGHARRGAIAAAAPANNWQPASSGR